MKSKYHFSVIVEFQFDSIHTSDGRCFFFRFDALCGNVSRDMLFQDMDLIEVLWKQDVDLGFTLVEPTTAAKKAPTVEKGSDDEIEKLKALEAINGSNEKVSRTPNVLSNQGSMLRFFSFKKRKKKILFELLAYTRSKETSVSVRNFYFIEKSAWQHFRTRVFRGTNFLETP